MTSHVNQVGDGTRYSVTLGTPQVYTRAAWADAWELDAALLVDSVEWGTNPKIHSATLSARYGYGFRSHIDGEFATVAPRTGETALQGRYVKIEIPYTAQDAGGEWTTGYKYWYGVIVEENRQHDGAMPYNKTTVIPTGRQSWTAYDLSWILQNLIVTYSVVAKPGAQAFECVGRALAFNEPTPKAEDDAGNMTAETVAYGGVHVPESINVFSSDVAGKTTQRWTSSAIVRYLLTVFTGQDGFTIGELCTAVPFRLVDMYGIVALWDRPFVETEGRSLKEVLDSVLDRRRLVGYTLDVDEGVTPHRVNVLPFTYTAEQLAIDPENNAYVWANSNQRTIAATTALDVESLVVRATHARKYDKVIVQGHPIVCCGTFSIDNLTLDEHWTSTEQTAYRTAASGDAGYSGWDDWKKQEANDLYRQRDALKRVYSWFGLARTWAGECDGATIDPNTLFPPETEYAHFPQLSSTPTFSPWYWPELRFLPHLPFLDTDTVPDSNRPEYRKLLAFMEFEFDTTNARYVPLDRLSVLCKSEILKDGMEPFSASVAVQQEAPGFTLNISGAKQHVIASGQWTPIDASEVAEDATCDYRTTLAVTAALESAYRVQVHYPDTGVFLEDMEGGSSIDFRNVLVIDYTRGAQGKKRGRLWWIAPETVYDIDTDGTRLYTGDGYFEKDEREPMRQLARLVYNWYAREARAVSLSVKQPFFDFNPGDMITANWNGSTWETVNSVVTEIRLDLAGDLQRTTIQTEFAEFDVAALT